MGSKLHTIIIFPHERARLRKWRVTTLQLACLAGLVILLSLGAGFVTWSFLATGVDDDELASLRNENDELRQVNQSFEGNVRRLQEQLADYETRTRKLAIVAGLESFSSATSEAGIGGAEASEAVDLTLSPTSTTPTTPNPSGGGDLSSLSLRASDLGASLDRVERGLDQRREWIAATPAIIPVRGILTSGFGVRRDPLHSRRAFHEGIDIAAAPGKPVKASADGIVTRAETDQGLGRLVSVAHGYGVATRYGHLSRLNVEAGEKVRRGDVIGFVGNTGRSTGYHLHYEVLVDGQAVNPIAYILDAR